VVLVAVREDDGIDVVQAIGEGRPVRQRDVDAGRIRLAQQHPAVDDEKATVEFDGEITIHRIASLGTPFHPTFRICAPWQASRAVPPLLEQLQPDLVHVQSHFTIGRAVLKAASERGIPAIATNHFMPENLLGYAPVPRSLRGPLARWAWRDLVRVYRQAQLVTAPTPRAVQLLEANGLPGSAQASAALAIGAASFSLE